MAELPAPDDDAASNRPDDPAPSIEAYEVEDGMVLYDARNPLAWLMGTHTANIDNCR